MYVIARDIGDIGRQGEERFEDYPPSASACASPTTRRLAWRGLNTAAGACKGD